MERINKDRNPLYYKSAEEMDKPMSELIEELRCEIDKTRGKLYDIKRSYGYDEWITNYEGGLTCIISAMHNLKEELEKIEAKQRAITEKV